MTQTADDTPVRPLPHPDRFSAEYWRGAREHKLRLQRCVSCRSFNHLPSLRCPRCSSEELTYEDVSGKGTIYSYTVVNEPPAPGFRGRTPLVIVAVEIAEQPHLFVTTNLVDVDPAEVVIGSAVEVLFEELAPGYTVPQFRLVKE